MSRPAVMLYFDVLPALELLDYEQKGRLFESIVRYGYDGSLPDTHDPVVEMAFILIKRSIDRDAESYDTGTRKKRYATYCREAKKRKLTPLSMDIWMDLPESEISKLILSMADIE